MKNRKNVTVSILIIILILLITSYVLPDYFNMIKEKEESSNINNINEDLKDNIDENIIRNELLNIVKKVPFSRISNNNSKELIDLRLIYDAFLSIDKVAIDVSEREKSEYFNLKKEEFNNDVYDVITRLNFTAFDIEKLHPELWNKIMDGNTIYYVIDGNIIKEEIEKNNKYYKFKLNKSGIYSLDLINDDETSKSGYILYEKDIDKFIVHVDLEPTGTTRDVLILDLKKEDNIYTIEYVEAVYKWFTSPITVINKDNAGSITDIVSSSLDGLDKKLNEYTMTHKDELSKYRIEFEILDGKYEFKNINKIN